ncbi:MAG: hypothetical protein JWQ35_1551 [Bacteriovoracaceae bacterium]|nr:hypothetical protein [Bacteriovoracaceae bacterium]
MNPDAPIFDVIILGAGATGLSAAKELAKKNKSLLILEAHSRIGGRVATCPNGIELGPEFIHGSPPKLYKQLKIRFERVPDVHVVAFKEPDFVVWIKNSRYWDPLDRILKHPPKKQTDYSFMPYFSRMEQASDFEKKIISSYIEGFIAADPQKVSARNVYDTLKSEASKKAYWPSTGYENILKKIFSRIIRKGMIRLNTPVKKILWNKNFVEVKANDQSFFSKKVINTLPVGVLKSKQVKFVPQILQLRNALSSVEMGQIIKIIFKLRKSKWKKWMKEQLPKNESFAFIHVFNSPICVFWLRNTEKQLDLIAWVGHLEAKKMKNYSKAKIVQYVSRETAKVFEIPFKEWKYYIQQISFHHWDGDPFIKGAYAYFKPNGDKKLRLLNKKGISHKLYFAGEAFAEDRAGTVDGAIQSGKEIAKIVLKSF